MTVAKHRTSTSRRLLPKASSKAGPKNIRSVDQLLTPKQRKVLRDDLSEMARRRRQAEASSSTLKLR